jgi:NAD(P)H-flavin reductase
MYKILLREDLASNIHLFKVEAPAVARKAQPGQFVVVRVDEKGERIPLTIADWDGEEGSITIVFAQVGTTTRKLAQLGAGDCVANFVGPLGLPTEIDWFGTVVCAGGCYGIAAIVPIVRALKAAGNRVISIIEGRERNLLVWGECLGEISDQLIVTPSDGSAGHNGVYHPLRELLEQGEKIDRVIAIGCTLMMMFCAETTEPFGVKTLVSLNPIMVDGTGMCGVCRVCVGGVTKFACVDGPEFDAHEVDWELLAARRRTYLDSELRSLNFWECQNWKAIRQLARNRVKV